MTIGIWVGPPRRATVLAMTRRLVWCGHLVWILMAGNALLGFVVPGFHPLAQTISEVALAAPGFAWTHRVLDVLVGLAMCSFAAGLQCAVRKRISLAALATGALGVAFASAGVWTLESGLHLLYNLSIIQIIVPIAQALEFKDDIRSTRYETYSLLVSFFHLLMLWALGAGFVPLPWLGLAQRVWAIVMVSWFGVAAHLLTAAMRHQTLRARDAMTSARSPAA
jgi:hypothetical protein